MGLLVDSKSTSECAGKRDDTDRCGGCKREGQKRYLLYCSTSVTLAQIIEWPYSVPDKTILAHNEIERNDRQIRIPNCGFKRSARDHYGALSLFKTMNERRANYGGAIHRGR